MKFQPDRFLHAITSYGPGWVELGGQRITHSLLLRSSGQWQDWGCPRFEDLEAAHFAPLAEDRPELVLFGSGSKLRFPQPAWLRPLVQARIGVETMDTGAACRTWNILAGEGRRVTAVLLLQT